MFGRMATDQKLCKACGDKKSLEEFPFNSPAKSGKRYRRCYCRPCLSRIRQGHNTSPEARKRADDKKRRKQTAQRAANERTDHWIWQDSRKSDKKRGFDNDLTKEFIAEQIAKGCSYCGETELRMTLDRIDNEKGHTMGNTVPACIRCNYVRRNMPYEAWVVVARAMKRARKQGLFGDWAGRAR